MSFQAHSDTSRVTPERELREPEENPQDTPVSETRINNPIKHKLKSGVGPGNEVPAYDEKAKDVEDRIRKDVLNSKMEGIVTLVDAMVPDVFLPISPDQFDALLQNDTLRRNNGWTLWPASKKKISEPKMETFVNAIGEAAQIQFGLKKRRLYSSSTFKKPIHDKAWMTRYKPDGVFLRTFVFLKGEDSKKDKKGERGEEDEQSEEDEKEDEKDDDYKEDVKGKKEEKSDGILWPGVMGPVEMKPIACAEGISQGSRYVQSVFNAQPGRQFVPLILVNGRKITLLIFDRSGAVSSEEMDVHVDFRKVLRLFLGMLFLDEEHLGFDSNIRSEGDGLYITTEGVKYKVECIYHEHGIKGRATVCYRGVSQVDDSEVVIKDTWVDAAREETEADILEKLNSNEEKDLSTPDGVRVIPKLVSAEIVQRERPGDEPGTRKLVDASTALFRQELVVIGDDGKFKYAWSSANVEDPDRKKVEIRILHRVVMKPFGQKLETFTSKKTLMRAFSDVVHAVKILHGFGYVHRDISFKNIILHNHKETLRGLLIDYDYTVSIKRASSEAVAERTGTIPFMAADRLQRTPDFHHNYFHDLESVFYVICWISTLYAGPCSRKRQFPVEIPYSTTSVAKWNGDNNGDRRFNTLFDSKIATVRDDAGFEKTLDQFASYFEDFKGCLLKLQPLLFQPTIVRSKKALFKADAETLEENYKETLSKTDDEQVFGEEMIKNFNAVPIGYRHPAVVFASFKAIITNALDSLPEEETPPTANEDVKEGSDDVNVVPLRARHSTTATPSLPQPRLTSCKAARVIDVLDYGLADCYRRSSSVD